MLWFGHLLFFKSNFLNFYLKSGIQPKYYVIDFSLTVKAVTLILISGRGSAISSAKQGKSGTFFADEIYNE